MKKLITILVVVAFLVVTLTPMAIAGGRGHYHHRHHYHGNGHGAIWLGLGLGVLTGAILSSYYDPPPRRRVYYDPPPRVVYRERVVIEKRTYGKPLAPAFGNVVVTAAEVNMRSGPGPERAVVGTVRKGDVLAVIDSIPSWFYVRKADGAYGWVMDRYTRPSQPLG